MERPKGPQYTMQLTSITHESKPKKKTKKNKEKGSEKRELHSRSPSPFSQYKNHESIPDRINQSSVEAVNAS